MRVLVTGSDGYVGRVVVERLMGAGHRICGIDLGLFSHHSHPPSAVTEIADIRNVGASELAGVEAIVHLAGVSNDPMSHLNPGATWEINYAAAIRLARLARSNGVERFIFASTCSVYGAAAGDCADETTTAAPLTAYAKSKLAAEDVLRGLADVTFVPVILRCATVYGMSASFRSDLVVNNLVVRALATGEVRLNSTGNAWRPLIHVDDLAEVYSAALRAPAARVRGEVINVGATSDNYQVAEIAQLIQHALPQSRIVRKAGAVDDARSYRVDFSKMNSIFPRPRKFHGLQARIPALIASLRHSPIEFNELLEDPFDRMAALTRMIGSGHLDDSLRLASP